MRNFLGKTSDYSDPESFFRTDHLSADLKGRSVRGGAATISSQFFKFVLQTGTTFSLARFLAPEDFGLIGMATVFLLFAEFFKDLGLASATVQKAEINHAQVNTLFWINSGIGFLTMVIVATLAPVISWFYKEPRLLSIILLLSINFLITSLAIQHRALLRRQMLFASIAKIELISICIATLVALVSAYFGANYWAIVISRVAQTITDLALTWLYCRWRPGRPSWEPSAKSMLVFGGNITGFRLANYFSRNLDNILIGRYWGPQVLGIYAVAYRLLLMPIQQINTPIASVALPALSRLQHEPIKYCRYYYKAIRLITTVGIPVVGFMFVSTESLILLVLGEKWLDAVPIFRFLMPAAFFGTFNVATGWAFESLNKAKDQLKLGVIISLINSLIFIVSVRWGAVGVAAAFGLSRPLIRIPSIIYCFRNTPLSLLELTKVLAQPTIPSFIAGVSVFLVNQIASKDISNLKTLLIDIFIYIIIFFGALTLTPSGRKSILEILNLAKQYVHV